MSQQKETLAKHPGPPSHPSDDDLDSYEPRKHNPKRRRSSPTPEPDVRPAKHTDTRYDKSIRPGLTTSETTWESDKKLIVAVDGGKAAGYDHSAIRRRTKARSTILVDWLKTGEQCAVLLRSFHFRLTVLV